MSPTEYQWRSYVHRHNLQLLGKGASRNCFALTPTLVLKLNHNTSTFGDQCRIEAVVWESADPATRELLATIRAYGEGWIVMERAISTLKDFDETNDYKDTVEQSLTQETCYNDLHQGNIGYFGDGLFKVIDYGFERHMIDEDDSDYVSESESSSTCESEESTSSIYSDSTETPQLSNVSVWNIDWRLQLPLKLTV